MNKDEVKQYHKTYRRYLTAEEEKHIQYCKNNNLVYQSAYELMFGYNFNVKPYKPKAHIRPRTSGGKLNGEFI